VNSISRHLVHRLVRSTCATAVLLSLLAIPPWRVVAQEKGAANPTAPDKPKPATDASAEAELLKRLEIEELAQKDAQLMELLTERSRQSFRIQRWRTRVRDHTVVVGYGTKGRAAVETLLGDGAEPTGIVVVDTDRAQLDAAAAIGLVTVAGNATRSSVLRVAGVPLAKAIVVATNRDDTAVLVTLTAREMAPDIRIVASVRESENVHLLRQSGASSVVVSAETAGRLLGAATTTPTVVEVIEDLLTPDAGFAISERDVEDAEVGGSPRHLGDIVLGVVRGGELHRVDSAVVDTLEADDRLLYVRKAGPP